MGLPQMLEQCAEMDVKLFQICDFEAIVQMSDAGLAALRKQAEDFGIELELGTKGVSPDVLDRYLHIARQLNVSCCAACSIRRLTAQRWMKQKRCCDGHFPSLKPQAFAFVSKPMSR